MMPQVQGIKAAAVVIYRKALITPEMGHHRLSHRVNNTVKKGSLLDITDSRILVVSNKLSHRIAMERCFMGYCTVSV